MTSALRRRLGFAGGIAWGAALLATAFAEPAGPAATALPAAQRTAPAAPQGQMPRATASRSTAPAWQKFISGRKGKITLDFRGAEIDNVLRFYSMASGVTITKDSALKGPVTIINSRTVSLDEAFRILEAVLNSRGFKLEAQGPVLKVVPQAQQPSFPFPHMALQDTPRSEESQAVNEIRVFELQYADADALARIVNDLFQQRGGLAAAFARRRNWGNGMMNGQNGPNMPNMQNMPLPPDVRASADTYTNSVVVNASAEYMPRIETLIKSLDKQVSTTMQTRVFTLQYANASDLTNTISSVLLSTAPGMRTAASQSLPFEQRVRGGGNGFMAYAAVRSQVVANDRTNSLVVTATPDILTLIEGLLKDLDKPVEYETTTYVLPLQNAQATDVAQLLTQALRYNSGYGGGYYSNYYQRGNYNYQRSGSSSYNRSSNYNRNSRSAASRSRSPEDLAGGNETTVSVNANPDRLPDPQENLDAENGDPQDPAAHSRQFGWGGGRSYSSSSRPTTGRKDGGNVVNLLDLSGQVTIVPDQNTNSLIISTTPENYAAIREIVQQLDVVPDQVMIEAVIAEASLDASNKLGVEWTWTQNNVAGAQIKMNNSQPNADLQSGNAFKFSIAGSSVSALLSTLATDTRFNVLSTPRIFTANNRDAQINISQRVPYVMNYRETEEGTRTYNIGYLDVGIVLDVTPHITKNGMVNIEVDQQANEFQGFTSFQAPLVSQRTANTTISVRDGDTIILGGIMRDQANKTLNKVPVLGDIPVVGNLFRSRNKTTQKTELMVFLTPHVVSGANQKTALSNALQQQVEAVSGAQRQQSSQVNIVLPQQPGMLLMPEQLGTKPDAAAPKAPVSKEPPAAPQAAPATTPGAQKAPEAPASATAPAPATKP